MGVPEVFPYLRARNAEEAVAFYKKAFGATEKFRLVEPSGRIGHLELLLGTAENMISDEFPEFDIHAADADSVIAAAVKAGAQLIRDSFGYTWSIGHSIEAVEPAEMQRRYTKLLSGEKYQASLTSAHGGKARLGSAQTRQGPSPWTLKL